MIQVIQDKGIGSKNTMDYGQCRNSTDKESLPVN